MTDARAPRDQYPGFDAPPHRKRIPDHKCRWDELPLSEWLKHDKRGLLTLSVDSELEGPDSLDIFYGHGPEKQFHAHKHILVGRYRDYDLVNQPGRTEVLKMVHEALPKGREWAWEKTRYESDVDETESRLNCFDRPGRVESDPLTDPLDDVAATEYEKFFAARFRAWRTKMETRIFLLFSILMLSNFATAWITYLVTRP